MKQLLNIILAFFITNSSNSQLYISTGSTLKISGNLHLTLENTDLVNNGTISNPSTGRFIFNGTDNNRISGTAITTFAELEIAKTSGGLLTLQTDINVTGKIIFTSNLIELNNHNIDLGTAGFLENENENSRITGINGGEILFATTLNAPSAVNPGNLGAVITSSQNLGNTIIHRGHKKQTNAGGGGSSIYRYFDISPTNNSGLNATLHIHYFDAEKNSLNENFFEVFKSTNNTHWSNLGHSSRDVVANYVEQTGLNDFSRWTLSNVNTALPVTGLQLSGKWENNAATIKWVTLTEYHNRLFHIERKYSNDVNFSTIGQKNSAYADGNSQIPTTYHWTDPANANKGTILYRIKQEDLDGQYSYSNIIGLQPQHENAFIINLYPTINVNAQLYIHTGNKPLNKMKVVVYDTRGSIVFNQQMDYRSQWIALPSVSAGIYNITVSSHGYRWIGNFLKK